MDDKSNEFIILNESGDSLGTTDFKYRIFPLTVTIQYSPFSASSKVQPFLGLGAGSYFYSYVNTGYNHRFLSEMFERNYTRFGLDLGLGNSLSISRHWVLDGALNYNIIFLHKGDTIGVQSNLSALRFFQISTGILYRI